MPSGRRRSRRRHPRALAVAVAGVIALIAAGGFGTPSLRPIGVGLFVLGVGAIVAVEAIASGLRLTRTVSPDAVGAGERAFVTLAVRGWPARNRTIGLVDWDLRSGLPEGLRAETRRPVFTRGELRQEIVISGLPRGQHRFGPPTVALADPFGLARVRRASRIESKLLVLPRVVPILIPFWESGAARRAGQQAGLLRGRSELGGIRDYEPGDPLSLIHWAQTARRGRLQTKELHGESGRGATMVVVLDCKGDPANGAGPDAPFEVAVCAAASMIAVCAARGDAVGLVHTGAAAREFPLGAPPPAMERELALVQPDGQQAVSLAIRGVIGAPVVPRTLVIVTAVGDRALAAAAGQARNSGVAVAAVLVGQARSHAQELRRSGAWVATAGGFDDLEAALDGSGIHAQRA